MSELLNLIGRHFTTFVSLFVIISTIVITVIVCLKDKRPTQESTPATPPITPPVIPPVKSQEYTIPVQQYTDCYEPKYLLTLNEKAQYKKLTQWAAQHNLIVFSKVRLSDLVCPRKGQKNHQVLFWKIQAKHVDFVICTQDIKVKCIVEISDNSHKQADRKERDEFVVDVLTSCGYRVLQTYNVTDYQLNQACGFLPANTVNDLTPQDPPVNT